MRLAETYFVSGRPVGRIVRDDFSGEVGFIAREGERAPPAKSWRDVDQLKAALRSFYSEQKGTPE